MPWLLWCGYNLACLEPAENNLPQMKKEEWPHLKGIISAD